MLSTTLLIPLLCAVGTRAVLPAHPPADGDQCGPTIQDIAKGDPQDSCKTVPPMTGRTPIPFGIAVMYNKIPSPATTYSWHQQCDPVVTIICDTMKDANSTQNGVVC